MEWYTNCQWMCFGAIFWHLVAGRDLQNAADFLTSCSDENHTLMLSDYMDRLIVGFNTKNIIVYYDQQLRSQLVTTLVQRAFLAAVSVELLRYCSNIKLHFT